MVLLLENVKTHEKNIYMRTAIFQMDSGEGRDANYEESGAACCAVHSTKDCAVLSSRL